MLKQTFLLTLFLLLNTSIFASTCEESLTYVEKVNERALSKMMMGDYESSLGMFKVSKQIIDETPECADVLAKESQKTNEMIKKLNELLGNQEAFSEEECRPLIVHLKKVKRAALSKMMMGEAETALSYLIGAQELINEFKECDEYTLEVSRAIDKDIKTLGKF
jgi:hypothetical protein